MEEIIKKILEVSINAPSGDNSQPWCFKIDGSSIKIFLKSKLDSTIYNFNEYGSYLSHGALIENIVILSTKYSLKTEVLLLPNSKDLQQTSLITFHSTVGITEDPLANWIEKRHTNRKPYRSEELSNSGRECVVNNANMISGPCLHLKDSIANFPPILKALSVNDELMFSNRSIHDTLFNIINWTEEEDKKKVRGLYVKTMELNNEQVLAFRQLQNWALMSKLVKIGIPKLIAATNRKLYSATPTLGLITIPGLSIDNYIRAGRMIERVWLSANSQNINLHPVSGIPYLALFVRQSSDGVFTDEEKRKILDADEKIRLFFSIGDETVAFIFRLGYGQPASAKSRKLPPEYI